MPPGRPGHIKYDLRAVLHLTFRESGRVEIRYGKRERYLNRIIQKREYVKKKGSCCAGGPPLTAISAGGREGT